MKVLMAVSECVPFVKTGGLADVAGSLPKGLKHIGVETVVVMPKYVSINSELKEKIKWVKSITVNVGWRKQFCGIEHMNHEGIDYYFIDNLFYFDRSKLYGYGDDHERFAYFSRACLEILKHIDFKPDVIHCHDWHTAAIPAILDEFYRDDEFYKDIRTVLTIHNLSYQGVFGREALYDSLGLSDKYMSYDKFEFYGNVNFMKGGIVFCDQLTTVSKTYSEEIQFPFFGENLDDLIRSHKDKLSGIVNGIDYDVYNPKTDSHIFSNYSWSLKKKRKNKTRLQEQLGIEVDENKPVIAMVTRLVKAKGIDLVRHIFDDLMKNSDAQFVVLGTGDYVYEESFLHFKEKYGDRVSVNNCFDNTLAHRIYAGADMILMPSLFEPCGITQLIGLRYGSIPIVRETGGLKDTIIPFDEETGQGNGFTFTNYNAHDMLFAIEKALSLYKDEEIWGQLLSNAVKSNYGWDHSAKEYVDVYRKAKDNKAAE